VIVQFMGVKCTNDVHNAAERSLYHCTLASHAVITADA
jgi:hypothetical protein